MQANCDKEYRSSVRSNGASSEIACNLAFGIEIGGYSFDKYFTKKEASAYPKLEMVEFYSADGKLNADDYQNLCAVANAVRYARDLCNEPGNYLTPEVFAEDIKRLEYLGLKVDIFDEKQIYLEEDKLYIGGLFEENEND